MFHRNKKTRNYQAPSAKVTHIAVENNFCGQSVRFTIQVDELDNVNTRTGNDAEQMYFEF